MEFLLSVIIPTYNCKEYLDATLGSVLQQLPEDEELIIVDDGSTDGTREMLSSYEGRQPNLRVFRREHRGASGARNAGLDEARGRYITFLDCDDQMREEFTDFEAYDLAREKEMCIARSKIHPGEK